MRFNFIISSLVLFPLYAFSQTDYSAHKMLFSTPPVSKNTIVKTYSNEATQEIGGLPKRTIDFPTQIIRTAGTLDGKQFNCDQVNEEIQKTIFDHITSHYFTYNAYVSCSYDPETHYATQFMINSYFDPISDEAVAYLKTYIDTYNNTDLMGTQFKIESSKGLIIALNTTAGVKKDLNKPLFIEYRQDRSNFFFKSNYEMRNKMIADIYDNFYSNDPEKILPFLNRWVFSYADYVYRAVLRDSNYVELQPERIFLMEENGDIFVSNLKYYFSHICARHKNHLCLDQK